VRVIVATEPGSPKQDNEDWATATPDMVVVLDGATALGTRTSWVRRSLRKRLTITGHCRTSWQPPFGMSQLCTRNAISITLEPPRPLWASFDYGKDPWIFSFSRISRSF
jgi:hypothetical protein